MKIGLIGINSQFVHSNLALYYLREELPQTAWGEIREFSNNDPILDIFYAIINADYDILAFSVYLWNKETVCRLTELIKGADASKIIILGGPEPTYAPSDFFYADYIVYGALEPTWKPLIEALINHTSTDGIPGIHGEIGFADEWRFPYHQSDLPGLDHRLVYYETSRGCPYHCAFCLSSAEKRTAFRPLDEVYRELDFFLNSSVAVVKLVDRTFNAPVKRGKEIIKYLLAHYRPGITFHFEIKGELLDEETVDLLCSAPKDYIQVEIGVQSLNKETLAISAREHQWEKTKPLYQKLIASENVHTHFDLIAALPHEDFTSFGESFNEVMTLQPHYLQLGFLKLLPGTRLCTEGDCYGYVAESFPPYEVIRSDDISCKELAELKKLDGFMDEIYNKGRYRNTLRYAMYLNGEDTFGLFRSLLVFDDIALGLNQLLPLTEGGWEALARLDSFLFGRGGEVSAEEEKAVNEFLNDEANIANYLPHYSDFHRREIYKRIRILHFPVALEQTENGMITVKPGASRVLIDFREKGKFRKHKNAVAFYLI